MRSRNLAAKLTINAMIAAAYIVLTLALKPISYGQIQFRLAEILNLFAFIDPLYGIGVTAGCFISNLFSELGAIDIFVGVPATALAVFFISKTRKLTNNLLLATLWPILFSGVMVGLELTYVFNTPVLFNIATVALGQFAVVTCVGYPVFRTLLKYEKMFTLSK